MLQQRWACNVNLRKLLVRGFLYVCLYWYVVRILTVTPYLRAIPCSVSPSVTRYSMYFSPKGTVTLAVLPYERVFVRAKLCDSSLSDSEPDWDLENNGCPYRPPPPSSRSGGSTGENSAIFNRLLLKRPWPARFTTNTLILFTGYKYACFQRHTPSSAFTATIFRGNGKGEWYFQSSLSLPWACLRERLTRFVQWNLISARVLMMTPPSSCKLARRVSQGYKWNVTLPGSRPINDISRASRLLLRKFSNVQ